MAHKPFDTRPGHPTPLGACDTHFHIMDPTYQSRPGITPKVWGTIDDYVKMKDRIGLSRFVCVHAGSGYGYDNTISVDAMKILAGGRDNARGVTFLPPQVSDGEIERLHNLGFRGIRWSGKPGDSESPDSLITWESLKTLAPRIAVFGWHVQVQQISTVLADIEPTLLGFPCDIVVDHMGRFKLPVAPDNRHWLALRRMLDSGKCWVKLSAPYHGSTAGPPHYEDNGVLGRELIAARPDRMLWGTNWPHPPIHDNLPDEAVCLDALYEWAGGAEMYKRILVDNPAKLYGFGPLV
jgi:D-galactarolactone isomerase